MGLYTLFLWGYFSTYNIWYNSGHNCRYPISQWYSHDIPIHLPRFSMGFYGFPMGSTYDLSYPRTPRPKMKGHRVEWTKSKNWCHRAAFRLGLLNMCLIVWYMIYIYIHIYNVCICAIGHPPIAVVVVMVNFLNWNIHQPTDLCSFLAIVVETIFTLLNSPFPRVDSWVLQRSRLGKLPWSNTSATVKIWVSCVIISINGYLCTHL